MLLAKTVLKQKAILTTSVTAGNEAREAYIAINQSRTKNTAIDMVPFSI